MHIYDYPGCVKPDKAAWLDGSGGPGVCQRNVALLGGNLGVEPAGVRQSLCGAETRGDYGLPPVTASIRPARSRSSLKCPAFHKRSHRMSLKTTDCIDVIYGRPQPIYHRDGVVHPLSR